MLHRGWFGLHSAQQGAEGLTHDPVVPFPALLGSWSRMGTENTTWLPWGWAAAPNPFKSRSHPIAAHILPPCKSHICRTQSTLRSTYSHGLATR